MQGIFIIMKLNPIFNTEQRKEVIQELSPAAEYAKELYNGGFKMQWALRRAAFEYGVDIHAVASELGKLNKRRRKSHGNQD